MRSNIAGRLAMYSLYYTVCWSLVMIKAIYNEDTEMKHPVTGEFMMPVYTRLRAKLLALGEYSYTEKDGAFWATADVLSKISGEEYFIVNEDFDPVVRVNFNEKIVYCDERGGWSRTYSRSFDELVELARQYETVFDPEADRKTVAKMGYKLIYAEHFRTHGLDFDKYFPMPSRRFLPELPTPEIDGLYFTAEQMLAFGEKCRNDDCDDEED